MKLAVASGKGGTGKTMIAVSLAQLAGENAVLADLDVEEPNAGLYFEKVREEQRDVARMIPEIDYQRCTMCGACADVCAFNALVMLPPEIMVFPELCHSCASCYYHCPVNAISEGSHFIGQLEGSRLAGGGFLVSGSLKVGEAQSPPLIKAVKEAVSRHAKQHTILDCPPGTGCGTLEAINGADYCLLVTEPTPFGSHDLRLALDALVLLGIKAGIIINRWRGDDGSISNLASQYQAPVLARIPFSRALASAFAEGRHPLQAMPELQAILEGVLEELQVSLT